MKKQEVEVMSFTSRERDKRHGYKENEVVFGGNIRNLSLHHSLNN